MTPLAYVRGLAEDLEAVPLPTPVHAQLGDIVVSCPETIASITLLSEIDPYGQGGIGGMGSSVVGAALSACAPIPIADVSVAAAHDCAHIANEDGSTNWAAQDAVSTQMDLDADVLWEMGEKWRADGVYRGGLPSITFTITGGLAITTMSVQLSIP